MSPAHQREHEWQIGEYYGVMLLSASGMVMLAHAANLVTVFLGIETMSIGVYVMCAMRRRSRRGNEAAMKYFLIGAFATGFLMYGIALLYGAAGTTKLQPMVAALAQTKNPGLVIAGSFLLVIAFGFKVAAVPFHMWAPDAYEGAPTPVTGFMAAGVKAAAFGAIVRLMGGPFSSPVLVYDVTGWANVLAAGAAITMTLGNLAAVRQENVKRLLAYSSIGHAGYLLLGVVASGLGVASAKPAVLFYLVTYTFTTLGAFGVVAWIGNRKDERLFIDDWAGISAERPGVALAMTIFLLSLGGVPPTAGFLGKFYLFKSAMESPQLYWLVVIAVLNSVVSVYYYLRIVVAMYFRDPMRPLAPTDGPTMRAGLFLTALAVVLLGVFPNAVVDWAGPIALK
jgi:NADH-quinone oxidoreductase subunit N